MPKILVKRAFFVLMSLSERLAFEPGVHDVSDDVAAHWYVQERSEPVADAAPAVSPDVDAAKAKTEAPTPDIDEMSDDQLREFIKTRDGRYPHSATGRDKLLAAAKGDKTVSDEIEAEPDADAAKA